MGSLARVGECGGGWQEESREGEAACAPKMAAINVPAHFVSLPGEVGVWQVTYAAAASNVIQTR